MAPPLQRGANVALTREVPNLKGVVLGIQWDAGADRTLSRNIVAAVIMCGANGSALSNEHFVFFNQLTTPDLSVVQLEQALGDDNEQIEVDLGSVPPAVDRIAVVLYINEGSPARRSLAQLRSCRIRVLNLETNAELTRSADLSGALSNETALVLAELYRRDAGWKFRVVGQGFANGVADIGSAYGLTW